MSIDRQPPFEPPQWAIPAWAFSLTFHAILLTAIGLATSRKSDGTGADIDRPVGVATVERLPDRERFSAVENRSQPSPATATEKSTASSTATASSLAPANIAPPIDLDGVLAEMTAGDLPAINSGELAGAIVSGAELPSQRSRLKLDAQPTTATVFGVSGTGTRFVYVFDRSDSMNGTNGRPLRAAKAELKRSLATLTEAQEFQIIFYNEEAKPFVPAGSPLRMLAGDASMIKQATKYVDAVKAFGGTEHFDALRMALRMGPDVVFFLTDARLPSLSVSQLVEIHRFADRSGATIHTIEFGSESTAPAISFLRQLAVENNGEYRYLSLDHI